jgi:vacuolar-type H+-ATPase subunit F/Vma7
MARVAALGDRLAVQGYALAGALPVYASDEESVRDAWAGLPDDVAVVILTPEAARALGRVRAQARYPLTVVMPR